MMTLRGRINKRILIKWAGYFAAAYLLASWGVNSVLDPVLYVKNIFMEVEPLEVNVQDAGITIIHSQEDYEQKNSWMKTCYLSFEITESQDFIFDLEFMFCSGDKTETMVIPVKKGWNSVEVTARQWEKIIVMRGSVRPEGLTIANAGLSEYRKIDVGKVFYIYASFVFLAVFWECIWWVKERYAE